jgi:hypothetical protein
VIEPSSAPEPVQIPPMASLRHRSSASSLVKIDAEGNKVEPSDAEINSGGFAIPSTVHMARPEIACVLHTHSVAGCAVFYTVDRFVVCSVYSDPGSDKTERAPDRAQSRWGAANAGRQSLRGDSIISVALTNSKN